MAAPPSIKRINIQELSSDDDLREVLVGQLNQALESIAYALTGQLTISENFRGAIKSVDLDGTYPVRVSWGKGKPAAVLPGGIERTDLGAFTLSDGVSIRWSYTQGGQVSIDQVTGITASATTKYRLSLVILMG